MAPASSSAALTVGMVLFPDVTQLDLTGPYEVFARMPHTTVYLVAATPAPFVVDHETPHRLNWCKASSEHASVFKQNGG